ncbi:MAG TPA: peptide chain release factor N(5)-glutamine methyltransferase [Anaerolineales bacterium]
MATIKGRGQTIGETLEGLISRLEKISDTPGLDAQVLVARLLDRPRSWVLARPEAPMTRSQEIALEEQVTRLEGGEPLPYILGFWEFFGMEFDVTPDVLIPRPETELLVERAIAWLRKPEREGRVLRVMDMGTGSGCIAISMAANVPGILITATDISPAALKVARGNAEKMHVSDRINFLEADLFSNSLLQDPFSLIVANPPYIPTKTLQKIPVYGREPTLALDGSFDGLNLIRRILREAPGRLFRGGSLLMEIEASEGPAVHSLATVAFPKAQIRIFKDLAGYDRLLEVQL